VARTLLVFFVFLGGNLVSFMVVILVLWLVLYSLRIENLHELLLGAIWTEDIALVGNETLANE
jgi:hypothetical protein